MLTSRMAPRSVLNYDDENALEKVINKSIELYLQTNLTVGWVEAWVTVVAVLLGLSSVFVHVFLFFFFF